MILYSRLIKGDNMEELMKNNDTFIKLEELMYLSLVGKFAYIHTCLSERNY